MIFLTALIAIVTHQKREPGEGTEAISTLDRLLK
jgi:hypothetical protein